MNSIRDIIWDFISSQYKGIIVGLIIIALALGGKKILNILKNIPKSLYKFRMEKKISESFKSVNKEMGIPLFPKITLKIVNRDIPPEELEKKIIIFVKKENRPFVYSNIIIQTLDKSFLRDSKRHIAPAIYDSVKFITGKSLITHDNLPDHLDTFKREALRYYERKMEDLLSQNQTLDLIRKGELIIVKKFFKEVLLQELYALGERMIGILPSDPCKQESMKFVDFLYDLARKEEYEREEGELPPLDFLGTFFKVGLLFVKKPEKLDLTNHFKAVQIIIRNGALSVYILGMGKNTKRIKSDFILWLKRVAVRDYNSEWHVEKTIEGKLLKTQEQKKDLPTICCIFRHKSWKP